MPSYMSIDATKKNGTARKTMMAEFGGESKRDPLTEKQIAAYAKRKSIARIRYEDHQKEKRRNA